MSVDLVLSIILGLAIGLSLGALGGGGSILTVPALVYALDVNAKDATGASLLIVGLSALIGVFAHHRARRVRWATGLTVGAISVAGSLAGTALNKEINPDVLLLVFAILMFVVAAVMVRRDRKSAPASRRDTQRESLQFAAATRSSTDASVGENLARVGATTVPARSTQLPLVLAVGVGVGFLTGFLGVGGGFIVVPSLVLALGFGLAEAVGTSLLIIAISSAFALAERGGVHGVSPHILVPFAASAMAAAVIGNEIAGRVPVRRLNQGFIVLVIVVACYVTVRSVLALG